MRVIYYCTAVMVCLNLGNSLGSTRDQSSSEERFNFFDAELFQVFNEKQSGNFLVSPISIKLVLGMLMEGAEGGSVEEIRAVLRFPHDTEARRKEFNTWLSKLQVNESSSLLKIANRVFMSDRHTPGLDFGEALEKYYSAGITSVKFDDPKGTTRMINDWVGYQTSQLIPTIVEEGQVHADYKLLVTTAVYFKGVWSHPFTSERSAVRCFYSSDNVCKNALMMTETANFDYGYISRLEAKAVVLPYKGGHFSMLLLLPSRKENVESLGRDLVHVSLSSILSETKEQEVFVQIPQFEITYNEDLVEVLNKLGISQVFGRGANLTKMFEDHLESISVSRIYHSAKITVNEEGSEAAAATGALFVPLMGGTTTSFVANRPFLFFVINSARNSVLFAGKVVSPLAPQPSKESTPPSNPRKILPQRTHNPLQEKPATPLLFRKSDYFQNVSEESAKAIGFPEKLIQEVKHMQRGQSVGPKFRSIKPLFSSPRGLPPSANERGQGAGLSTKFTTSFIHPRLHSNSASQQAFLPKETQNYKGGKPAPEKSGTYKRQKPPPDDWRHHVLFFT